jgi:hypothetical protein
MVNLRATATLRSLNFFEYRWVDSDRYYSPYENDNQGRRLELIRINDSKCIKDIASKGRFQEYLGPKIWTNRQ